MIIILQSLTVIYALYHLLSSLFLHWACVYNLYNKGIIPYTVILNTYLVNIVSLIEKCISDLLQVGLLFLNVTQIVPTSMAVHLSH